MAARVAARLREETGLPVETARGGLGELKVTLDGEELYASSRFWYPTVQRVVGEVRGKLPV